MIEDDNKNKPSIPFVGKVEEPVFEDKMSFSWSAVSMVKDPTAKAKSGTDNFLSDRIDFAGKDLAGGKFSKEKLDNASFTVANLEGIDFSGSSLRGVDFSGSNLKGANFSDTDLEGAVFNGAQLKEANFTGAKLKGVKLAEADIEDAILLDIEIDELGLEELQHLIEYLAKYYPHKLNLTKINLTLLDLTKIDLKNVNLRGVDFTGCNMTGVNIAELDLSECIITPEQIAQALGRVPSAEELAKLLAPKKKDQKKGKGIDFSDLFSDRPFGVIDTMKHKGSSIEDILKTGKKVFRHSANKPPVKDSEILDKIKEDHKKEELSDKEALRVKIEENKRKELEKRLEMQKDAASEPKEIAKDEPAKETKTKHHEKMPLDRIKDIRQMDRG